MRVTKAELEQQLQSANQTIEELENALIPTAMKKVFSDLMLGIQNELKGDCLANHLEEFVRAIVPTMVFMYVSGTMAKEYIARISRAFIYVSPELTATIKPSTNEISIPT